MADPKSTAADTPSGWANSIVAVLKAVQRGPYAAMLAIGLLLIFAAFIKRIGTLQVSTTGSQPLMLAYGAALCAIGFIAPVLGARHRQQQVLGGYALPPEANNVDFMFTMFYLAMPPAFVKRVEKLDEKTGHFRSYDILYSRAFDRFQEAIEPESQPESDEQNPVAKDHHDGDAKAIATKRHSYQIEFPPNSRLPILTIKTHFMHKGHHYIAGWYVPVNIDSLKLGPGTETIPVRQVSGQIMLRPVPSRTPDSLDLQIGAAVRSQPSQ